MILDSAMQDELERDGFFIKSLLSDDQINSFINIYNQEMGNYSSEGFQNIMNLKDPNKRKRLNEKISNKLYPILSPIVSEYTPFICSYNIKFNGNNNVPIHLDWSVVDENKYISYNTWIALEDIEEDNGCMGFLKGSHHFGLTYRGSLINNIASPEQNQILKRMKKNYEPVLCPIKKGDLIIYDHRIAHFSLSNKTKNPRKAMSMVLIPKLTTPIHYHFEDKGDIIVYSSSTDFYLNYDLKGHPSDYLNPIKRIERSSLKSVENQLDELNK